MFFVFGGVNEKVLTGIKRSRLFATLLLQLGASGSNSKQKPAANPMKWSASLPVLATLAASAFRVRKHSWLVLWL